MIHFDPRGHIKPYQPVPCSLKELKTHFVDAFQSARRQINYNKYLKYSDDLKALMGGVELKQWVNGSFVTKKSDPKDIDLVTFINHSDIKRLGNERTNFMPEGSWMVYGVDAYIIEIFPETHKGHYFTKCDIAYWLHQFGHARVNRRGVKHPKGFLEIIY